VKIQKDSINGSNTALLLAILSALCLFLFFFRLAETGIIYPSNEPRRMLLAKDMVSHGHWLIPYLLGKPYITKPPILIWLISAGYLLFGSTNLWATRFFTALVGLINVIVTYFFAKKLFNKRVGFFAALILATSLLYIFRSRMAEEDIIVALFVNLSLYMFLLAYHYREGRKYYILFYVFVSLACLTKGPSGVIFSALPIVSYLFLRRDLRSIKSMELLPGVFIFSALVLLWYIYAYHQVGTSGAQRIFLEDTWYKFFPQGHSKPFYHYLISFFPLFFPWSVFLPALAVYFFTKKDDAERTSSLFLMCWLLTTLFFFSLAGAKRNEYILPLYPALAMLTAQVWNRFLGDEESTFLRKVVLGGIYTFALLLIGASLAAPIYTVLQHPDDLLWNGLLSAVVAIGGVLTYLFVKRRHYIVFFPVAVILMVGFIFDFTIHVVPTYLSYKTPHTFCANVASIVGQGHELISFRYQDEYIINELDRVIEDIKEENELDRYLAGEKKVYIIMDGKDFLRLKKDRAGMHLVIFQEHFLKRRCSIALVANNRP
jgi:4-amino-4-deoxy-L-arabinose transferase-like glycosyltransferase